ncbi:TPA: DUF551 domain-containing protein [Escherichia coli]
MGGWIKCSEMLPDAEVPVLVTDGSVVIISSYNGFDWGDYYWTEFSTHWMPLPEPPSLV